MKIILTRRTTHDDDFHEYSRFGNPLDVAGLHICSTEEITLGKLYFDLRTRQSKGQLIGDGSNYVPSSMFDRSMPKIGCSSLITRR